MIQSRQTLSVPALLCILVISFRSTLPLKIWHLDQAARLAQRVHQENLHLPLPRHPGMRLQFLRSHITPRDWVPSHGPEPSVLDQEHRLWVVASPRASFSELQQVPWFTPLPMLISTSRPRPMCHDNPQVLKEPIEGAHCHLTAFTPFRLLRGVLGPPRTLVDPSCLFGENHLCHTKLISPDAP